MQTIKRYLRILLSLVIFGLLAFFFVEFYSYIFSRRVKGVIESIERVQLNVALMQSGSPDDRVNPQLFSFSVAVREPNGEILTASAEDRQWAVAKQGLCVEAVFYPYPPWKLMKSGTYFNARLDRLFDCSSGAADAK